MFTDKKQYLLTTNKWTYKNQRQ